MRKPIKERGNYHLYLSLSGLPKRPTQAIGMTVKPPAGPHHYSDYSAMIHDRRPMPTRVIRPKKR
jgi:hypothetical protein